jgi:hypothetical protein
MTHDVGAPESIDANVFAGSNFQEVGEFDLPFIDFIALGGNVVVDTLE